MTSRRPFCPTAFDAAIDVFNPYTALGQRMIFRFLFGRQFAFLGFLVRRFVGRAVEQEVDKAQILQQKTFRQQGVGRSVCHAVVMCLDKHRMRRAHKQDGQGLVDQEAVFHRIVLFLAAITARLFQGSRRPSDRAFGAFMTKRG